MLMRKLIKRRETYYLKFPPFRKFITSWFEAKGIHFLLRSKIVYLQSKKSVFFAYFASKQNRRNPNQNKN